MINEGTDLPVGVVFQDQHQLAMAPPDCTPRESQLRSALAESEARLRQRDETIQRQDLLNKEADHRLLNDLQIAISLLSLQSREATNAEVAKQLSTADVRIAMIARIHQSDTEKADLARERQELKENPQPNLRSLPKFMSSAVSIQQLRGRWHSS